MIIDELKKDFEEKFVKPRLVDDLDLDVFWGWVNKNFVPMIKPKFLLKPQAAAEDDIKAAELMNKVLEHNNEDFRIEAKGEIFQDAVRDVHSNELTVTRTKK